MPQDDKKVLPADFSSDYSLPGRFEESNFAYVEPEIPKQKPSSKGIWIMAISIAIVALGFFSFYFMNQDEIDSRIIQGSLVLTPENKLVRQYDVGEYGSDHAHAAITIFVNNELVNFGHSNFQLLSKYIHFENHNPYLIHKHATGAPLEILFLSLGIKITPDCIIINYYSENINKEFCSDKDNSLRFYINGNQYDSNISQYEFDHNDRILISFGKSDAIPYQLEFLDSLEIFDIPKKTPNFQGENINL